MIPHYQPDIGDEELAAVVRALRAGRLALGPETETLERELAGHFAGADVVCVSSGTAALLLALRAVGVTEGAKVVIPTYTCNSVQAAVTQAGGVPVCADVQAGGVTISRETVARVIGDGVAAVVVPHTLGYRADVESIAALGVHVIEDCAQAFPEPEGPARGLGQLGTVAVLSFYATKLLAGGEGGACVTRDPVVAAAIRAWRNCDAENPDARAFNFKMTDIAAALVRAQLARLPELLAGRRQLGAHYNHYLEPWALALQPPAQQVTPFRFLIRTGGRAASVVTAAAAAGIECRRPVRRPLHQICGGRCPEADRVFSDLVSIPCYPRLSLASAQGVTDMLIPLLTAEKEQTSHGRAD